MKYLIVLAFGFLFYALLKKFKLETSVKALILLFVTLILINFFGSYSKGEKAIVFVLIPFIFFEYRNFSLFKNYILVFLAGLFLSMLSSQYFRGQAVSSSLPAYTPFFSIIFYFFLKSLNLRIETIEKVILILIVLFIGAYIIQYFIYPVNIFLGSEQKEYGEDVRVRITGQGLASLGYFLALNKILLQKKKNIIYFGILFACTFIIFIMGFRTILAALVPFTIYLVYKCYGFSIRLVKISIAVVVALALFINIPAVNEKIDLILKRNKEESFQNKDYIRITQFTYFTQKHFKNGVEYVMGSGIPQRGDETLGIKASQYGIYMQSLVEKGINWVDFGLLSMSWVLGILPIVTLIVYSIKAFRVKVRNEYLYVGIWFLFLVIISFTTLEAIRPGNLALHALGLVMIELAYKDSIIFKRKLKFVKSLIVS